MPRRIFILDAEVNAQTLHQIDAWAKASNARSFETEEVWSGNFQTPFLRVTLEFPDNDSPPSYPEYIPFSISVTLFPDETYTAIRERLDLAILSSATNLPVDDAKVTGKGKGDLEISYFLRDGEPLWIDSSYWNTYAELLSVTKDMQLVSIDPRFGVALLMYENENNQPLYIFKHPHVDVWYASDQLVAPANYLDEYMDRLKNIFVIATPDEDMDLMQIYQELMIAFGLKSFKYVINKLVTVEVPSVICVTYPCPSEMIKMEQMQKVEVPLPPNHLYIEGNSKFDYNWFQQAAQTIQAGGMPYVNIDIDSGESIPAIRHKGIEAYLQTLEDIGGSYLSPGTLTQLSVSQSTDSKYVTISLPIDCIKTYNHFIELLEMDSSTVNSYPEVDLVKALLLRYRISKVGSASLYLDGVVTWKGSSIENLPSTTEAELHQALYAYVISMSRDNFDPVSLTAFKDLSIEDLADIVITSRGNGYELATIYRLDAGIDPLTNLPFTSSEIGRMGYNTIGLYSFGPLRGLRDEPPSPTKVEPLDGIITAVTTNHITTREEVDASEENREAVPSEYKDVEYRVTMDDGLSQLLVRLLLLPGKIERVQRNLTKIWNDGDFLSWWARAYIQSQGRMSYVNVQIPFQLHNVDSSITASDRAEAYIEMLAKVHSDSPKIRSS